MAYTNRTINLNFDGTDDNYPMLGDDIWITILNPMLMPASKLQAGNDVKLGPDGQPTDMVAAMRAGHMLLAQLVVDWHVYDPTDDSEDPAVLPLPATIENVELLPMAIINAVSELIGKALNPR